MNIWHHVRTHTGTGLFKGSAVVFGTILYILAIIFKGKWIVAGLNANQELIRTAVESFAAIFPSWADTAEASLRSVNYERTLLVIEIIVAVKLVMILVHRCVLRPIARLLHRSSRKRHSR